MTSKKSKPVDESFSPEKDRQSKKPHCVYAFCICADPELTEWFVEEFKKTGKRLDMGKSCVRFKSLEAIPLDLIGKTVAKVPVDQFIRHYEANVNSGGKG